MEQQLHFKTIVYPTYIPHRKMQHRECTLSSGQCVEVLFFDFFSFFHLRFQVIYGHSYQMIASIQSFGIKNSIQKLFCQKKRREKNSNYSVIMSGNLFGNKKLVFVERV